MQASSIIRKTEYELDIKQGSPFRNARGSLVPFDLTTLL